MADQITMTLSRVAKAALEEMGGRPSQHVARLVMQRSTAIEAALAVVRQEADVARVRAAIEAAPGRAPSALGWSSALRDAVVVLAEEWWADNARVVRALSEDTAS